MFRAALFDLDGTLLDTLEDLADSANEVLRRRGLPVHPIEAYRTFVGDGVHALIRRIVPGVALREEEVDVMVGEMKEVYARRWKSKSRPYEGMEDALASLEDRGMTLAVLSNKPDEFTRACVSHFFPSVRFVEVRGARPGVPLKPSPEAALAIVEATGIPAADWLYVGDTATDMQTAVAAELFPVGVLWGFREAIELREHGAATLIRHPRELADLRKPTANQR